MNVLTPQLLRSLALTAAVTALAGACTGNTKPSPTQAPRKGGSVVFAGRFFTECGVNPITCPAVNWNPFSIPRQVLPRAMEFDAKGNLVSSDLLVEAPTLENGGLTQSPFTVRFKIRPEAGWDDGFPITSTDFDFTWRALKYTTRPVVFEEGYERIRSIDATDPQLAVIEFSEPFADWGSLFGGTYGYLLKRAAFPRVDPEHPDLAREMASTISFSGGPFRLEHADVGTVVLVRNERYFGRRPYLDKATFVLTRTEEESSALRVGRIAAVTQDGEYPGALDQLKGTNIRARSADGMYLETLTFNFSTPPLNDPVVREALVYAVDRRAMLDRLVRPNNPRARVLNCGFLALPDFGPWCRTRPFERFIYDPARSRRILENGGYDCSSTVCTKAGRSLEIAYWVQAARARAIAGQSIAVERAREAGFALIEQTFTSSPNPRPWEYPIVEWTLGLDGEPSITRFLACDQVSSGQIGQGNNWMHWCNREADRLMHESDREIDPARRLTLLERVYELEAQDFVSLPLYVLPVISAWRTDKIAGPIGRYSSTPYGMFFNMNEWFVPASAQT